MRTLLLGDIGNRLDIADTERSIEAMRSSHVRTVQNLHERDQMIEVLRAELGQQKLAIQALTRFLVDSKVVDSERLAEFVRDVDAEDGVIDGKLAIDPVKRRLVLEPGKKIDPDTFKKAGE